jgi:antitoxin (DNA-binding transcriptional repressor) of toxin-antitoxin stability system/superfamily II DNA/RNA helicase
MDIESYSLGEARPVFTHLLSRAASEGLRVRLLRRGVEVAALVGHVDLDNLIRMDVKSGRKPIWSPQRPESPRTAREQLSDRLLAVEAGERVVVLRRGRPYAAIIPPSDLASLEIKSSATRTADAAQSSTTDLVSSEALALPDPISAAGSSVAGSESPSELLDELGADIGAPMVMGPKIRNLWREALWSSRHQDVSVAGERLLKTLESPSYKGPALDKSLTEMQASVLSACRSGDPEDNPFLSDRHVLISGGTSSGKTTVTEIMAVSTALNDRGSVIYVAPTRALAQARYQELRERYASTGMFSESGIDKIILSTGEDHRDDYRFSSGRFGIGVLVYEKANLLAGLMPAMLDKIGLIVVDEAHMVTDLDRGPRLEMFLLKVIDRRMRQELAPVPGVKLRMAIISTEPIGPVGGADHPLYNLLTVTKSVTGATKPPIQIEATERPGVVTHKLVLPPIARGSPYEIIDIESYERSAPRLLDSTKIRKIEQDIWDAVRARGSRELSSSAYADLVFALLRERIQETATSDERGRRILVFMPAISMIENFANRLRNASTSSKEDQHEVDNHLLGAFAEIDDDDEKRELKSWAERGIFVHHAALSREVRAAVVEHWAIPLQDTGPSEILLSTETLSYGLNLAIDDVVMYGLQSPQSQRGAVFEVKQTEYTPTEFWNMTGRAGRLGLNETATIFIVPTVGERSAEIISRYYGQKSVLTSQLFTAADDLLARDEAERADPLKYLSHPFAHAMLDLLRYRGRARGTADDFVSVDELMELLNRTLFFKQSFEEIPRRRVRHALQALLDGCATVKDQSSVTGNAEATSMRLVERRQDELNGAPVYRITERGSDVLDTGTQLRTLIPMYRLADALERGWQNTVSNASQMPAALALLAVVGQKEVNSQVIRRLPESRLEKSSDEARERNHQGVVEMLVEQLAREPGVDGVADAAKLATEMSAALYGFILEEGFSGALQELQRDAILRLFVMMLRWIDGQSRADLRKPVTQAFIGEKSRFGTNIPAFCERTSWKLDLLARVLRPRLEPVLSDLVARVRLGCRAQAIGLLEARCPGLGRGAANRMLEEGQTPDYLLRHGASALVGDLDSNHLLHSLSRDAADQFIALTEDLGGRLDTDDNRTRVQRKVLNFAEHNFYEEMARYQRDDADDAFSQAVHGLFIEEDDFSGSESGGGEIGLWSDKAGLRQLVLVHDPDREGAFEFVERRREAGVEVRHSLCRVLTMSVTPAWQASVSRVTRSVAAELSEEASTQNVILALSPWLPPTEDWLAVEQALRLRSEGGQATAFMTAPGFWTMLLLLVREFAGPDELLTPFLSGGSVTTIGVRDLHKQLTTGDHADASYLPAAIRRALARFRETGASLEFSTSV